MSSMSFSTGQFTLLGTIMKLTLLLIAFLALYVEANPRFRRVIGGESMSVGDWPYLASLKIKTPATKFLGITLSYKITYCTASLINDRWVLTAAHCLKNGDDTVDPEDVHVRLGDTEMFKDVLEKIKGKLCKLDFLGLCDKDDIEYFIHGRKIKIHEHYNPGNNWENDIALIQLAESVPHLAGDKAPHIQSVKLNDGSISNFPNEHDTCYFQGWGCTRSGGSVNKNALQVQIPIYPNDKCSRTWGIDSSIHLCAGMKSTTTTMGICPGDSGGPLVCLRRNTWYQVGVASFTSKNSPGKYPGAFGRISTYYEWIKRQTS